MPAGMAAQRERAGSGGGKLWFGVDIRSLGEVKTRGTAMVPEDLLRDVSKYAVIDEKWWYWTDEGAARYIMLTKDSSYGVFERSRQLLEASLPDITKRVQLQFIKWGLDRSAGTIQFISLGAGDFRKEGMVLESFLGAEDQNLGLPVHAVPLDMSLPLAYRAMTVSTRMFGNRIESKNLLVEPFLADYTKINSSDFGAPEFRYFTAFATVHNARFPDVLEKYKNLMTEKSVILLDVDVNDGRGDYEILKSYNNVTVQRFFYTPLDLIQKGAAEGGDITEEDGRVIGNMSDYERCTLENGVLDSEMLTVGNMDGFIKRNNLPADAADRIRISPDTTDKTVAILYHPRNKSYPHPIVLGFSTRFNRQSFKQKLEQAGFEVIADYFDVTLGTNSLYLLKLAGT